MSYDTKTIGYSIFIGEKQALVPQQELKMAIDALSEALLKENLVRVEEEYDIERQGTWKYFTIRVKPPE